jgi:hypothetical protein
MKKNKAVMKIGTTRKDQMEKRILNFPPSLTFPDVAPHPLVNRLSDDWREYMYLFLGCQQSILARGPGKAEGTIRGIGRTGSDGLGEGEFRGDGVERPNPV